MRVAFLDPLEARLAEFPARYLAGHDVLLAPEAGRLPDGFDSAEAVVWWAYPVDSALVGRLPSLRFMQRIGILRSRGDATAALARKVPVSVIPHGVSDRVALHALSLTLAVVRKVVQGHEAVHSGLNPDNLPSEETTGATNTVNWARLPNVDTLNEKTVGIVGFGEIGACYSRLIRPFDCRVLYYKRSRLAPEWERHFGVEYASLDDLLRASDIVMSSAPYTEETRKMIGAREFALMKPSAAFVNVGRGNTVDEPALIDALRSGTIAFAGIDVYAVEPLPLSSPLLGLKNVVLTPHSAGGVQGWQNTFERIAENLRRVEAGRPVILPMSEGDPQPA